MKKYLILLFGLLLCLNVSTVKADTVYPDRVKINYSFNSLHMPDKELLNNRVNDYLDIYNSTYIKDYPYYIITLYSDTLYLAMYKEKPSLNWQIDNINSDNETLSLVFKNPDKGFSSKCTQISCEDMVNNSTMYTNRNYFQLVKKYISNVPISTFNPYFYYRSNFDLYIPKMPDNNFLGLFGYSEYYLQDLGNSNLYNIININSSSTKLTPSYINFPFNENEFVESQINLNDYAYVALSLKNYNLTEEFYTNFKVKGQLCLTPVYNYGTTERKDVLNGSQIQGCTPYYDDFTDTRVYITSQDLKNHAIYYLKPYDKTKENVITVDKSIFDITLISEEDKDNPQVLIDGKVYPTKPFDQLTDTSNKSEDEGYVPGVSCTVGDLNCYKEYNPSNIFDDIFDSPLKFLKSIWNSIISIFTIINQFIMLLPITLQTFFYLSFMLAVIIGIIKIIL